MQVSLPGANCSNGKTRASTEDWPLEKQFEVGKRVVIMLARNKYFESLEEVKDYAGVTLLHSYVYAWLKTIVAVMNFKKRASVTEGAIEACVTAIELIEKKRKQRGWTSYITNVDYDQMTDEQCHAELIFAEMQALFGGLTAIREQSFFGFIKAALKIKYAATSHRSNVPRLIVGVVISRFLSANAFCGRKRTGPSTRTVASLSVV